MKKIFFLLFLISLNSSCQNVEKAESLPQLETSVNDFENILEWNQENLLKAYIRNTDKEYNIAIFVVTVDSIKPYETLYEYSLDLANQTKSASILIVISKQLKQIQIQNSNAVMEKLTNEETKSIIVNYIAPQFAEGKYYKGLTKGISQIRKEFE